MGATAATAAATVTAAAAAGRELPDLALLCGNVCLGVARRWIKPQLQPADARSGYLSDPFSGGSIGVADNCWFGEIKDMLCLILRRGFAAALITTTVREQHPRPHHRGATSMQTHLVELATQFYVLAKRALHSACWFRSLETMLPKAPPRPTLQFEHLSRTTSCFDRSTWPHNFWH